MKLKIQVEIDFAGLSLKDKYDRLISHLANARASVWRKAANLVEARSNAAAFLQTDAVRTIFLAKSQCAAVGYPLHKAI